VSYPPAALQSRKMVPWLSTALRVPQLFSQWGYRSLKRRFADRESLVREGADVVTPVIDRARQAGPEATVWGTDEEVIARLGAAQEAWEGERTSLLTYANHHPSEEIRQLAQETAQAIQRAFSATSYMVYTRKTATDMKDYNESKDKHAEAVELAQKLMDAIRAY
jgi:hypothetical protein